MKVTFTEGRTDASEEHPTGQPDWRWTLDGDNGEPLAVSSEGYVDRRDAIHGFQLSSGSTLDVTKGAFWRVLPLKDTVEFVRREIQAEWVTLGPTKNPDGDAPE